MIGFLLVALVLILGSCVVFLVVGLGFALVMDARDREREAGEIPEAEREEWLRRERVRVQLEKELDAVREAWGDPDAYTMRYNRFSGWGPDGMWAVVVNDDVCATGTTESAALDAARKAAP